MNFASAPTVEISPTVYILPSPLPGLHLSTAENNLLFSIEKQLYIQHVLCRRHNKDIAMKKQPKNTQTLLVNIEARGDDHRLSQPI